MGPSEEQAAKINVKIKKRNQKLILRQEHIIMEIIVNAQLSAYCPCYWSKHLFSIRISI